jgi:hypothetical protein
MGRRFTVFLLTLLMAPAVAAAAERFGLARGGESGKGEPGPNTWQVEWHNDAFANSDNQFTSGFSVLKHSRLAASLAETSGTPAFGKTLARWFLPDDPALHYRESWAAGQNLQTPDDLLIEDIVLNDVPYVGMAGWSNSFVAFDDTRFTGFGLLLGWVGESAGGADVQNFAHRLTGANKARGWDHQLDFEPLINLYFMKKRKLWQAPGFDAAVDVDLALGNFFTFGQVALEMRAGDAPDGFTAVSVPVGRGLSYDGTSRQPGRVYTYASLVLRATGFVHALPRQGNTFRNDNEWTENNTVDVERVVGQAIFGLHHERVRWGMHLTFWLSTNTIKDDETLFPSENPQNSFGTITLEWRP